MSRTVSTLSVVSMQLLTKSTCACIVERCLFQKLNVLNIFSNSTQCILLKIHSCRFCTSSSLRFCSQLGRTIVSSSSGWTIVPDLVVICFSKRGLTNVESDCFRTCNLILPRLKEYLFENLGDTFVKCAELIKLNL